MTCDHLTGDDNEPGGGFMRASELPEHMTYLRRRQAQCAEVSKDSKASEWNRKVAKMTDDELLDRFVTLFRFCPDCGARLRP